MSFADLPLEGEALTSAISAAIVELYARVYDHQRTTATTYINDNVVLCLLEDILSDGEQQLIGDGADAAVIDARVSFEADSEDEFSRAVERLTERQVVAFLSGNQTNPGVACELFMLDRPPAGTPDASRS